MHENPPPGVEGCRALVTGGAGAVGSHIVDALLMAGVAEVRVLDLPTADWERNLASARAHDRLSQIEGDVRDRAVVDPAVEGVDLVFHQAGPRLTESAEDPRLAHEVMADGTFQVVDAAARAGVSRLIAASSAVLYGPETPDDIRESFRTDRSDTLYGALKAYDEALLRVYTRTSGLRSVALRYFNVYGPRMKVRGRHTEVLVRWIERIERGDPPVVDGDGTQAMDFVYIEDVARANLLAAGTPSTGRAFNVGTGDAVTLNELARTLLRVMRSGLPIEYGPPRALNAAHRRVADSADATRELGFRASVSLEEGLRKLVTWWRSVQRVYRGPGDPRSSLGPGSS